ncbi:MAG: hypothetical protein JRN09_03570 [Nitrososphaerota archaeon]|nr:hypothetical protein [Nitrososphaerota archaeon]
MKRRRGISSIYGFIMIFLLSMASVQTWSYAVSSMASVEGASAQQHQVQQMQSVERLTLSESSGNLTVSNTGQIPSTVQFLRLIGPNDSRTIPVDETLAVGSSLVEAVPLADTVQVVTSLGDVFTFSPPPDPGSSVWSGAMLSGGQDNAQVFQSPYDPSSFFVSYGPSVYSFSSGGLQQWSFDAGAGYVTDVLPISNGDVFVSTGYGLTSNSGDLFLLSAGGTVIQTYPVRYMQTPGGAPDNPAAPVTRGEDSSYVLYDGWFYSESGPFASLQSDDFPLAGSDAANFYFFSVSPVPDVDGSCQPPGNEYVLDSYAVSPFFGGGVKLNWQDYVYFGTCNRYPQQLVGSAVGGGVVASLLASPAYAASPGETYPAQDPYLVIVSTAGHTLYQGQAPDEGYSALATNGTDVYLALPQSGQVQVYSLTTDRFTTYSIGIQASRLVFDAGDLFAISGGAVKVFTSSMSPVKTIDLSPLSLASTKDSFLQEPALQAPSFLVLNATSYAALLVNATGYSSLVIGDY